MEDHHINSTQSGISTMPRGNVCCTPSNCVQEFMRNAELQYRPLKQYIFGWVFSSLSLCHSVILSQAIPPYTTTRTCPVTSGTSQLYVGQYARPANNLPQTRRRLTDKMLSRLEKANNAIPSIRKACCDHINSFLFWITPQGHAQFQTWKNDS